MPVYAWKGLNNAGKAVGGTKDADGPKGLRQKLRKEGIFVTEHKEVLGGAAAAPGRGRQRRQRREGPVLQARDRSRRPARARAAAGRGGADPPARDPPQGGHPAGRGAGGAGRAGRQQEAGDGAGRGPGEGQPGHGARRDLRRVPEDLPRPVRQHGPLRRGGRKPGRGAAAARRLHGRAERAARQGGGGADLPDLDDGAGDGRHGDPDGRGRPEDHLGVRRPRQEPALEHGAADLRVRAWSARSGGC